MVPAPAKINLFLHVTGVRGGYHTLQSLAVFADAADWLECRPSEALSLHIRGPGAGFLPEHEENIVLKTAKTLKADRPLGAEMLLEKRLPIGAGLGGGSADAAAALRALAGLWKLDPALLPEIAARLGADVPACLLSQPCWMEGIGERLTPIPNFPELQLVLCYPSKPLATEKVFRTYRERGSQYSAPIAPLPNQHWLGYLQAQRNDLEPIAVSLMPEIATVLAALRTQAPLLARMSGSGSACFGIFPDAEAAKKAAAEISRRHPSWWVRECRTISSLSPASL